MNGSWRTDCGEKRVSVRYCKPRDRVQSQKNESETEKKVAYYSPNIQCDVLQVMSCKSPNLRFMNESYTTNKVTVNVLV